MVQATTIFFLAVSAVLCHADPIAQPITCGAYPSKIFECLAIPDASNPTVGECNDLPTQCEKTKCVFKNMGWSKDGVIDKSKVAAFFEQFAKDYPAWKQSVSSIKAVCLTEDLPSQGAEANCPTYDIKLCTLRVFFKNAKPSQWLTTTECAAPRQYVEACPICPPGCEDRSKLSPTLCNACKA